MRDRDTVRKSKTRIKIIKRDERGHVSGLTDEPFTGELKAAEVKRQAGETARAWVREYKSLNRGKNAHPVKNLSADAAVTSGPEG